MPIWVSPVYIFLFLSISIGVGASIIPDDFFQLFWGTQKNFRSNHLYMVFAVATAFVLGSWLAKLIFHQKNIGIVNLPIPSQKYIDPFIYISILFSVIGYFVWIMSAMYSGLSLSLITSSLYDPSQLVFLKTYFRNTIPGVTTLTQLAPAALLLVTYMANFYGFQKYKKYFILLLILIFIRVFIVSERLAIVEFLLPSLILYIRFYLHNNQNKPIPRILKYAPLIGFMCIFSLFSLTEFFRSYSNQFLSSLGLGDVGFFLYSIILFFGYYIVALNTSASMVDYSDLPFPYYTLVWFWKLPILSELLSYEEIFNFNPNIEYGTILFNYNFTGLNNPGGLFLPIVDWGFGFGLLWWFLIGFSASLMYRSYLRLKFSGLLLYPFFFIGLLEFPRYLFWTDGRAFPAFFLLFCIIILRKLLNSKSMRA